ncbi:S-adenosyl-L-methionine-dependent methyltransferase [Dendrothele bispora CBS 962.96]|uniref:S-adenosyl-L-methionine-dependent methyltransferase n=1 Tax=Dendrothele bispora (strain CBS 962.96) TaxID=1314807 RepID=A0A4S8LVQ3_DENBC|nr:S-adenosyl-L-methionine-dependent methyltransferase [Dendrothele bispora CBS 962.96]
MAESLTQLASLISGTFLFPNLDAPSFSLNSEAFRSHPDAAEAAKVAAAACLRLAAALVPPTDFVNEELGVGLSFDHHKSVALRICLEANVTEILREAGPMGLHADDIAVKCGLEPLRLGRILRYLATHHCYREISPNVFTSNRISSTMDTGKSVQDLKANPDSKYENCGFAALCSHRLDFELKFGAVAWEALSDAEYGFSDEPNKTMFSKEFQTDLSFYQFLEQPSQRYRRHRFGYAMQGLAALQPPEMILKALDWTSLPDNAEVVDVGGGLGTATMPLVQKYSNLTAIIQDLPNVIEEGKKLWKTKMPAALAAGRVRFEVHDFLSPQPIKDANVFLVKQILHNWSVGYTTRILRHLREAAQPNTLLVIIENITPYACRIPSGTVDTIAGAADVKPAPEPLLPNYGGLSGTVYGLDMGMMGYFNAQEFTILQLKEILENTGWQLTRCTPIDARDNFLRSIVAVPI